MGSARASACPHAAMAEVGGARMVSGFVRVYNPMVSSIHYCFAYPHRPMERVGRVGSCRLGLLDLTLEV